MPPRSESILGLKVEALRGKQVSLEWTETSGGSGNGGTTLSSSRLSCGERLFLRCEGKGSLLSSYEAETGLFWLWAGLSCFLSSGSGTTGCHGWVHAHPREAYEHGWMVHGWANPEEISVAYWDDRERII